MPTRYHETQCYEADLLRVFPALLLNGELAIKAEHYLREEENGLVCLVFRKNLGSEVVRLGIPFVYEKWVGVEREKAMVWEERCGEEWRGKARSRLKEFEGRVLVCLLGVFCVVAGGLWCVADRYDKEVQVVRQRPARWVAEMRREMELGYEECKQEETE